MGGGEREGEGFALNGSGAAPVTVGGGGGGGGGGGPVVAAAAAAPAGPAPPVAVAAPAAAGGAVEKVKFTVSVRGHQWSSARHVNETLQEFATAIQRNARRLEFIEEGDSIQRLQLAYADGSEPEDLDVDATLGDVIICMGDKQLVAIVNSARASPPNPTVPNGSAVRPDTNPKLGLASPISLAIASKPNAAAAPNGFNGLDTESKFMFPPYKPSRAAPKLAPEPSRPLKIAIPPQGDPGALPFQDNVDRGFHSDQYMSSSLPPLGPARSNGRLVMGGCKQQGIGYCPGKATPSPAELANMLVRSSSQRSNFACHGNGVGMGAQCGSRSNAASSGGFQSFASALLSRLPVLPGSQGAVQCPHGASTNIALLAQFLASQLRAFVPVENARPSSPCRENQAVATTVSAKDAPHPNGSNGQVAMPEKETHHNSYPEENGASPKNDNNVKLSLSGSHEREESSSSANVNAAGNAPTGDVVDSAHPNGRNELVFLVNRRSKTGVGTHHLKMSDLSTYFHLSVVDAAKKLGVSQTTLKKACRKFGLKRWPGRKVRSLESTIHGLEHTIAVGQGAGLEELTEAYMRNEVQKLQQEMNQLVHGTPAQHSPAVRTADLYKRLYSRGWRSKYHSAGRHDVDLTQPSKRATDATKVAATKTSQQQQKQKPAKDENQASKQGSHGDTVMKDVDIEGLLREPASKEDVSQLAAEADNSSLAAPAGSVPVDNGAVVNCNHNTNGEKGSSPERESLVVEDKEITFQERSPKRPKRECRTAAEAAVRQGLRSSTCAIHPTTTGTFKYVLPKLELEEELHT